MDQCEAVLKLLLEALESGKLLGPEPPPAPKPPPAPQPPGGGLIPVGISNRHVHLSRADLTELFGEGYELTRTKDLSQPGQYACKETVTICGPRGSIEKVRILGPVRPQTQVEVMAGDCIRLGAPALIRLSGDLMATPGITIVGPRGTVKAERGLIVAKRHIHMTPEEARSFGVKDGQLVHIQVEGERGGIYSSVAVRATWTSVLECHLDIEEANAMNVNPLTKVTILN